MHLSQLASLFSLCSLRLDASHPSHLSLVLRSVSSVVSSYVTDATCSRLGSGLVLGRSADVGLGLDRENYDHGPVGAMQSPHG